jgi:hypothetical protein
MLQEGRSNDLASRERSSDRNVKDESFGIHIPDVDTTLMCEKDAITLALRIDTNVVFGVGGMREERLDNEIVQSSGNGLNLTSIV